MKTRKNRRKYVIAWHYAGDPRQPLLFGWQGRGPSWGCDFNIGKATRFDSPGSVAEWWLSKHAFPEDYENCLYDGSHLIFEMTKSGMNAVLPLVET